MRPARVLKAALLLLLLAAAALALLAWARRHPEDLPWTELDLGRPIGAFTGRKLAGLAGDADLCRSLLARAGVRFESLPPRSQRAACSMTDSVRLAREGALRIRWRPDAPGMSCPVAAALALWEWHVVQPAAIAHFGRPVEAIDHLGAYSCRRLYGRDEGPWSEHATANAIDVAGFRIEGGTRVSVLDDWDDGGARGAFLKQVRDGACTLFATTLSPDYNRAHADHFHLDQAARGEWGGRMCR